MSLERHGRLRRKIGLRRGSLLEEVGERETFLRGYGKT